jgi:hypothetical protein
MWAKACKERQMSYRRFTFEQISARFIYEPSTGRLVRRLRNGSVRELTVAVDREKWDQGTAAKQKWEKGLMELPPWRARGATALNVLASPMLFQNRRVIIEQAAQLRLPAIYQWPETAEEEGLLGYGRLSRVRWPLLQ